MYLLMITASSLKTIKLGTYALQKACVCSGTGPWMNGHFATAACQDGFGLRDFALGEWLHWSVHTGSLWPLLVDIRIFVSKINPFVFKSSGCRSTEMNAMHDVFK